MAVLKLTGGYLNQAYVREEQYLPGCPAGAPYNYQTWMTGPYGWKWTRAYDGPDRRTRPVPLIWNPTSRGPMYEWECRYLKLLKHNSLGGFWCYANSPKTWVPVNGGYYNETQYIEPCTTEPVVSLSNSDLVTGIRLGVKEVSMNLAEFIGEYRETVEMVSSGVKGVVDICRGFRDVIRGRTPRRTNIFGRKAREYGLTKRNWKRRLKELPSSVLLADFGLSPLVDGASDALDAWNTRTTKPLIRRVTLSRRVTDSVPGFTNGYVGKYESSCITSKRAIVYARYEPNKVQAFTAGNPFEAYWASVPFSFLVDRFVNVGSFLSSLDAMDGVIELAGTITTKKLWDAYSEQVPPSWLTAGWFIVEPGLIHWRSYQREVIGQLDLLPVLPGFRPSGSARLLRDLTAILASFNLGR